MKLYISYLGTRVITCKGYKKQHNEDMASSLAVHKLANTKYWHGEQLYLNFRELQQLYPSV